MTGEGRLYGWGRSRVAATVLALIAPAVSMGAGRVEIVSTASIRGGQVRIGDIAELRGFADGERSAQLKETILFDAPPPGERRTFHFGEIREALYERGINLGEIELRGAAQVTVTRIRDAGVGDSEKPGGEPGSSGSQTLQAWLLEHIQGQFAEYQGRADIQFSRTQESVRALSLRGPVFEFRMKRDDGPSLGLVSFAVQVLKDHQVQQTVHILAEVALLRTVAVASRSINRGRTIESSDVQLVERRFSRLTHLGQTDLRRIVGYEARRFMDRGKLIDDRDVKEVPLVRRHELVTVWNRSGGLAIRTVGKALGSGGLGDSIEIKSERSGERYPARIVGVRTVEAGAVVRTGAGENG